MCSYCGCKSIAIVGRFMAEHEAITNLLTELRSACAAQDADRVKKAVHEVEHALHPHTAMEETTLFSEMKKDPDFTEHIESLCREHTMLDEELERLAAGEYDLFHQFEIDLRNHMDREDNGLFPASAIILDGPQWEWIHAEAGMDPDGANH